MQAILLFYFCRLIFRVLANPLQGMTEENKQNTSHPARWRELDTMCVQSTSGPLGLITPFGIALLFAALIMPGCKRDEGVESELSAAEVEAEPEPEPPPPPTREELALTAFHEGNYAPTCELLEEHQFDREICDWIAGVASEGKTRDLIPARFRSFLKAHRVRQRSGSIQGWYSEQYNMYEARIGGRLAILEATETAFRTTGRFTMWMQPHGTSLEVLTNGREVLIPVYREWALYQPLRSLIRAKKGEGADEAKRLLRFIRDNWTLDFCYVEDPDDEMECATQE